MITSKQQLLICALYIASLILICKPAGACFNGLIIIPTADIVQRGGFSVEMQVDGTLKNYRTDTTLFNSQFGISNNLEAGIDYDASSGATSRFLLNAKYMFARTKDSSWRAAIGTCGAAEHSHHSPYFVVTRDCKSFRLHMGEMLVEKNLRGFVGFDHSFNDKLAIYADYSAGSDHYSSVGLNYQMTKNFSVLSGIMFPNTGSGARYSVHFVFTGP